MGEGGRQRVGVKKPGVQLEGQTPSLVGVGRGNRVAAQRNIKSNSSSTVLRRTGWLNGFENQNPCACEKHKWIFAAEDGAVSCVYKITEVLYEPRLWLGKAELINDFGEI